MKSTIRKQNMTKLLVTATMCAVLLIGAAGCNNANTNDSVNNNDNPAITDENVMPTETIDPDAGAVE